MQGQRATTRLAVCGVLRHGVLFVRPAQEDDQQLPSVAVAAAAAIVIVAALVVAALVLAMLPTNMLIIYLDIH